MNDNETILKEVRRQSRLTRWTTLAASGVVVIVIASFFLGVRAVLWVGGLLFMVAMTAAFVGVILRNLLFSGNMSPKIKDENS